ncbi:hypothetical protein OIY81_2961 [Cryptosporidium canis]|nr:hypothetical protein OIY81_2961 [Cryptosporidium canis]
MEISRDCLSFSLLNPSPPWPNSSSFSSPQVSQALDCPQATCELLLIFYLPKDDPAETQLERIRLFTIHRPDGMITWPASLAWISDLRCAVTAHRLRHVLPASPAVYPSIHPLPSLPPFFSYILPVSSPSGSTTKHCL